MPISIVIRASDFVGRCAGGPPRLLHGRAGKAISAIVDGTGGAGYSSLSLHDGLHAASHGIDGGLIVLPWAAGGVSYPPVLGQDAWGRGRHLPASMVDGDGDGGDS